MTEIKLETNKLINHKEVQVTLINNNHSYKCNCVTKHIPKYSEIYKIDFNGQEIFLCPTGFANLCSLEVQYIEFEGDPPGSVRKHFSEFIRNLYLMLVAGSGGSC